MSPTYPLKIDAFCHIIPKKFKDEVIDALGTPQQRASAEGLPALWDMDHRRRTMDRYQGVRQIINLGASGAGKIATGKSEKDLAKFANDEMAELVAKYPDYFIAAIATLPMNDIDAALDEIDRTIVDLKFRGIQIHSPVGDKTMDSPEFEPIYEKMCKYDLPIQVHPWTPSQFISREDDRATFIDRKGGALSWPMETADMMQRMTYSGMLEKYPNLKILTHHAGGAISYYEKRLILSADLFEMVHRQSQKVGLSRPPIEYLKKFYCDTATVGTAGLMCCRAFCGTEKILFGTDYPHDNQLGDRSIRETINSIEQMEISDAEKTMIFEDNARNLFKLPG